MGEGNTRNPGAGAIYRVIGIGGDRRNRVNQADLVRMAGPVPHIELFAKGKEIIRQITGIVFQSRQHQFIFADLFCITLFWHCA